MKVVKELFQNYKSGCWQYNKEHGGHSNHAMWFCYWKFRYNFASGTGPVF